MIITETQSLLKGLGIKAGQLYEIAGKVGWSMSEKLYTAWKQFEASQPQVAFMLNIHILRKCTSYQEICRLKRLVLMAWYYYRPPLSIGVPVCEAAYARSLKLAQSMLNNRTNNGAVMGSDKGTFSFQVGRALALCYHKVIQQPEFEGFSNEWKVDSMAQFMAMVHAFYTHRQGFMVKGKYRGTSLEKLFMQYRQLNKPELKAEWDLFATRQPNLAIQISCHVLDVAKTEKTKQYYQAIALSVWAYYELNWIGLLPLVEAQEFVTSLHKFNRLPKKHYTAQREGVLYKHIYNKVSDRAGWWLKLGIGKVPHAFGYLSIMAHAMGQALDKR